MCTIQSDDLASGPMAGTSASVTPCTQKSIDPPSESKSIATIVQDEPMAGPKENFTLPRKRNTGWPKERGAPLDTATSTKLSHATINKQQAPLAATLQQQDATKNQQYYHDYSRLPIEDLRDPTSFIYGAASSKEPPFPLKLHQILSNPEYQDMVCWLPHGRSWRVIKPKAFEEKVIPLHFRHCRYASFMRQVNGWGFKRVLRGPDLNSYYHEFFLRGLPHLSLKMHRPVGGGKPSLLAGTVASGAKTAVPDFYSISARFPLPVSRKTSGATRDTSATSAVAAAPLDGAVDMQHPFRSVGLGDDFQGRSDEGRSQFALDGVRNMSTRPDLSLSLHQQQHRDTIQEHRLRLLHSQLKLSGPAMSGAFTGDLAAIVSSNPTLGIGNVVQAMLDNPTAPPPGELDHQLAKCVAMGLVTKTTPDPAMSLGPLQAGLRLNGDALPTGACAFNGRNRCDQEEQHVYPSTSVPGAPKKAVSPELSSIRSNNTHPNRPSRRISNSSTAQEKLSRVSLMAVNDHGSVVSSATRVDVDNHNVMRLIKEALAISQRPPCRKPGIAARGA